MDRHTGKHNIPYDILTVFTVHLFLVSQYSLCAQNLISTYNTNTAACHHPFDSD